ncbi:large ribosomal subunit protein uL3 [Desulfobacterium sp. N47]|uniref:Large ribosomal subunit protein uL3 n=1 Tax=uncultured Desulfobacterium sp. TaxID=201089 RepID=E1YG89_9BACT|nr:50S ribosomal protein L3 [uncultured Desulfobacterium sp.]
MCRGLIGKKLGMTVMFSSEGKCVPVTVLKVGPCVVTQIKSNETDGYNALQIGFGEKKKTRINKPVQGHLKKGGLESCEYMREFSVENPEEYKLGQILNIEMFNVGDLVDVSGIIKGRGFSGVIKRHGFSGGRKTHGSHCHRIPGSIGASAWPSRVFKGKKLPGHYGCCKQTMRNLEIIDVRQHDNLILLKGAVPGPRSGMISVLKPNVIKK